jgi:hypothetical protein
LKTVDEYYIGANNSIQDANVQMIIDTVSSTEQIQKPCPRQKSTGKIQKNQIETLALCLNH